MVGFIGLLVGATNKLKNKKPPYSSIYRQAIFLVHNGYHNRPLFNHIWTKIENPVYEQSRNKIADIIQNKLDQDTPLAF